MYFLRFAHWICDRFSIVIGAFVGSQVPMFMQQYQQQLSGRISELEQLLKRLTEVAAYSHKSLTEYIQKFLQSQDLDFVHQGEFMQEIVTRHNYLQHIADRLGQSYLWQKPWIFMQNMQMDIAENTFKNFQTGFIFTLESMCYAASGAFLAFMIYQSFVYILFFLYRQIRYCFYKQHLNKI